jgi:hypothetical protein
MKLFVICSKTFFPEIPAVKKKLEKAGHTVELPFGYESPFLDGNEIERSEAEYVEFKKKLYILNSKIIETVDAVLCLNFEKQGRVNYIGAGTFLILHLAFMKDKKIFLWNYIPEGILHDELVTFNPVIIKRNIKSIK